ncbi:multicopper oxidase domain-containing protein [Parapedobacter indicus]|uniref:Multicopper oxidase with three cupredoxin domains (Includes cell division protein FtsP and spore coat protein CotA) n=1 Tax=Parapedobacter indicus TaxID=1477437 RepID=A0A1I3QPA2_9SPHI|nr:multicopper oxidase domain-containing protein [Parapedobacter indicus]PPL00196.1 FtsP/CotA-like multicopper oxidase with cupredoxin domain [Parapedobacter indicus]SFJ35974.1 Multicopper oxidase with three cupredoxin domains (includes cell division protein FtsP and spore coat protein CotA) [Parapedobacter indicus]
MGIQRIHGVLLVLLMAGTLAATAQRTVRYDLNVTDTVVNYTGNARKAIAINGQLPAPTLHFTEGDTAEIHVHNHMHHETSIHWHGILLPNEQDGVPYLTTAPIKGMSTHVYRFPIRQSGTYWYHSHTMLQEQIGLYGAFIIHKKDERPVHEEVMLLSDWSDENPHQIERSLHRATDWYGIRKGATQSYGEGLLSGHLGTKFINEWKRMHAMDVSDVYYERFLLNGDAEQQRPQYRAGDKVRVRVINGSSSTYFWLTYAGGPLTVVASDGADVEPVTVDRLIVGVSETYDVEVTIPADGAAYELVATSEDRIGQVSLWLGDGVKQLKQPLGKLDYFEGMKMMNDMMTVGGDMKDMGMDMSLQQMDMNAVMYPEGNGPKTLNYAMLRSPTPTALPDKPFRTLHFELTGNMNRYVWTINNKTVSERDKILIKKGENIRIILTNNSMMRHPMHLHGHFFRVVNGQGDYAPLKNVLDIMPMETDTLEFNASEEYGDWFFHCHILYHMMSGMGRIFTYEDSPPNPQIPDPEEGLRKVYADDRRFYLGAEIGIESNASDGDVVLENTRWAWQTDWHLGPNKRRGYEVDTRFGRYLDRNQFLMAFAGGEWRYREGGHADRNWFGQTNTKDDRTAFHIGLQYTLPWFIVADLRVNHNGYVRLQIERDDIPVTARLRLRGLYNSDGEYTIGAKYILTKYISLSSHYDSDMGLGGGLTFTY